MKEVKATETLEVKMPKSENYKEIKPETNITPTEAREIINSKFSEMEKDNTEKDEQHGGEVKDEKQQYDDNGNMYCKGNELLPNNRYELNGYKYETDDKGRIISAEGKLQVKNHEGRRTIEPSKHDIGKGDERETDDRGHLVGDRFNGSEKIGNFVSQDSNINQKDFAKLENKLAAEVNLGKDVRAKVEPIYDGDSNRPAAISYTYSIDGKISQVIFPNGKE